MSVEVAVATIGFTIVFFLFGTAVILNKQEYQLFKYIFLFGALFFTYLLTLAAAVFLDTTA